MDLRGGRGAFDLGIGRTEAAVADVLPDAGAEHEQVLRDERQLPVEIGKAVVAQVSPVQQNSAVHRIVEARNQAQQSGFARARRADDADLLPGADLERHVVQHARRPVP